MLPTELLIDGEAIWDRIVSAVQAVRERLERATQALESVNLSYAVIGGNAVYLWMEKYGEGGERNTPNVDLLVNRTDLFLIKAALESVGFCPDPARPDLFRDGPSGSPRTHVRPVLAGEKVRETDLLPNPGVACPERIGAVQVLALSAVELLRVSQNGQFWCKLLL